MRSYHIYLKNGEDFTIFGNDYSFDIVSLSIFDNEDRVIFTIKSKFLKLVRYYDSDCAFDYESEKVIFHAM